MIQNGLDVLLRGIAETLAARVAPEVTDDFARGQVLAAADLLTNLAPRVAWDRGHLLADDAELRALLRRAVEHHAAIPDAVLEALADPPPADAPAAELEAYARRQLRGLAALQRSVAPTGPAADAGLAEAVAALVDRRLDAELALLQAPRRDPRS